jgi:hypothetical protein
MSPSPLHLIAGLTLCASLYSPNSFSETVVIPLGKQGDYWNIERPKTGTSQAEVEAKYGEPLERSGPLGTPPISSWTYPNFIVYFEYDHVIHSVVIKK